MLNYPTRKKPLSSNTSKQTLSGKSTYANRGMTLESDLSIANEYYLNNNKAVIYKKPTPIQVLHIKNLENALSIANECTTLEEFISKIQAMIDLDKERINQIKLENKWCIHKRNLLKYK